MQALVARSCWYKDLSSCNRSYFKLLCLLQWQNVSILSLSRCSFCFSWLERTHIFFLVILTIIAANLRVCVINNEKNILRYLADFIVLYINCLSYHSIIMMIIIGAIKVVLKSVFPEKILHHSQFFVSVVTATL